METKELIMVNPAKNNNKLYRMVPTDDGRSWTAEYGRCAPNGKGFIGNPVSRRYALKDWERKYSEKLSKGYVDRTAYNTQIPVRAEGAYAEIGEKSTKALVDNILLWADRAIKAHYSVSSGEVTSRAVADAQKILNDLATAASHISVWEFNDALIRIFHIIPRQMREVASYCAKDKEDFKAILDREQALLDAMSSRITRPVVAKNPKEGDTILDAHGLTIRPCGKAELERVKQHLDPDTRQKFSNAWHVTNRKSRRKFEKYCQDQGIGEKDIRLLYHGSRNENYWNILTQGLKLRPTTRVQRSGSMFGHGLYFAPKAGKSMGYTSLQGTYWARGKEDTALLLCFKVAMGRARHLNAYSPVVSCWNYYDCKSAGYDSVYAHAGISLRNDECIVYREEACTPSYIIELKV